MRKLPWTRPIALAMATAMAVLQMSAVTAQAAESDDETILLTEEVPEAEEEGIEEIRLFDEEDAALEEEPPETDEEITLLDEEEYPTELQNPDFEEDIWGDNGGWTVKVSDWKKTGAEVKPFRYSSDSWMQKPSDGSDTGVNFWFGEGAGYIEIYQIVKLLEGENYNLSAEVMGEGASFRVANAFEAGEKVDLTGYNNWITSSISFSYEGDVLAIVGITIDVEKGGWGYINNIKLVKEGGSGDEPIIVPEPEPEPVDSDIYVERVPGVGSDFISGVDVSSYMAEKASGVKFYDFEGNELDDQGFFDFLHQCGVNYVRIRVWNYPYDDEDHSYGGGNCDLENAEKIGLLATNAGMRVLIDFHYSDF